MGKNKYRFKGHESFILREGWLNKGLYEVDRNPKVFQKIMEQMHLEWNEYGKGNPVLAQGSRAGYRFSENGCYAHCDWSVDSCT